MGFFAGGSQGRGGYSPGYARVKGLGESVLLVVARRKLDSGRTRTKAYSAAPRACLADEKWLGPDPEGDRSKL